MCRVESHRHLYMCDFWGIHSQINSLISKKESGKKKKKVILKSTSVSNVPGDHYHSRMAADLTVAENIGNFMFYHGIVF